MILFFVMVFSAGKGYSQRITINKTNVPIQTIFTEIEKQSQKYSFFYNESLLEKSNKVSMNVRDVSVEEALSNCFKNQPLTYAMVENTIIVKKRDEEAKIDEPAVVRNLPIKISVSGKVTDANGQPVAGATVTVRGTDVAVPTDVNGFFKLENVEDNSTLVITSVAHLEKEVKLNKRSSVSIELEDKVGDLDEAIVVAYNTTTAAKNVSALTVVKGEQIRNIPVRSFDKSLQGLVPGLQITNGTGQPGGALSNIVLRGINTGTEATFGSTIRNPLIVIDGIPITQDRMTAGVSIDLVSTPTLNPLAQINTSDIESITVLKDAAAVALYGSKASNGVIVITTRSGKSGKTIYNFRHQTDIAKRLDGKINVLNRDEYMELLYETYKNTPRNPSPWTDALITTELYKNFPYIVNAPGDTSLYPSADWYGALFNDQATTFANEFSMSGGNERNRFYMNLEYTKQNGIVKKTGYDRKSIRINFESRPANNLKMGVNTLLSYNISDFTSVYDLSVSSYGFAPITSPLNPIYDNQGNYILNFKTPLVANPAAEKDFNFNKATSYRGLTKLYGEFKFLKYLTFTSNVGFDFMLTETNTKQDPRLVGAVPVNVGRLVAANTRRGNIINTNILRFDKSFNSDHVVNLILGQEAQILTQKLLVGEARGNAANPPLYYYDQLTSPGYSMYSLLGSKTKQALMSLFAQGNYGFRDKYFLTGSIRGDGSSQFGDHKQWGKFWSAGAGWVISSEPFMKATKGWLSFLKIRGSVGASGSSAAVIASTRYNVLTQVAGLPYTAFVQTSIGNPNIKWERSFNWDAGLEMRLLKDKLSVTADIYNRKTTDLIYSTSLPSVAGYGSILDNIGDMKNSGIELSITASPINTKNFTWKLNANWSTNQNKLVKANVPLTALSGNLLANEEGRNFNSFYLRRWAGVDPATGAPMWIDSTGKPSTIYNAAKREFVGKPQPDGFGSVTNVFSYKSFDLSVQFYYQYGFQLYQNDGSINDGNPVFANQDKKALNRWRKPGDIAANPIRKVDNSDGGIRESTRFLVDGDYIRLQNLMLGYTLPKSFLQRLHLQSCKVFVQGNNLAIWTKFSGNDPDNANVGGSVQNPYPIQKSYSIGLDIAF